MRGSRIGYGTLGLGEFWSGRAAGLRACAGWMRVAADFFPATVMLLIPREAVCHKFVEGV